ncbi:MAG: M3 family oligoendopeptidase [Chitinophagales bacterium]|nr:M3 family oligoendopeptidase [Chitinophagales bacterium]
MKYTFSEIPFSVPNFKEIKQKFESIDQAIQQASSKEEVLRNYDAYNDLVLEYSTLNSIATIKFYGDLSNEEAKKVYLQFDENNPILDPLSKSINRSLFNSPFKEALKEDLGQRFFELLEFEVKLYNPNIHAETARISQLCTQYEELASKANYSIDDKNYNEMGLMVLKTSGDRSIRKKAMEASTSFFYSNKKEIGDIFSELVKKRHEIAQKSGLQNYHDYSFIYYGRTGYNKQDIEHFRNHVAKHFKPLQERLMEIRKEELKLEQIKYYDLTVLFDSGSPRTYGSNEEKLNHAVEMYDKMSPQTGAVMRMMKEKELFDIDNRPNKLGGGFMSPLSYYKVPYIFTSFGGSSFDYTVLTHEFGHAFQYTHSLQSKYMLMNGPSLDAVETFSMAMEIFAYPYVPMYFKQDSSKFYLDHLKANIGQIINMSFGDEFQQMVYENVDWTDEDRNNAYLAMQQKYTIPADKDHNAYLIEGNDWKSNSHFVTIPFYYIDYGFAISIALQLYQIMKVDYQKALSIYIKLCENSAGLNLMKLIEITGLKSPFEEETIRELAEFLKGEVELAYANFKATK